VTGALESAAEPEINLPKLVADFADALLAVDQSAPIGASRTRTYQPGLGPLTEREAVKLAAARMIAVEPRYAGMGPARYPGVALECDLVIPGSWAIEIKLARPFGDNGMLAEHWSDNLLYPYPGNVSALGDALKLRGMPAALAKGIVIYGFEHSDVRLPLEPAIRSFEIIAARVLGLRFSERVQETRLGLIHPTHSVVRVYGWQIQPEAAA
jgi:hypothetical protein